jgi:hypothetical protein
MPLASKWLVFFWVFPYVFRNFRTITSVVSGSSFTSTHLAVAPFTLPLAMSMMVGVALLGPSALALCFQHDVVWMACATG